MTGKIESDEVYIVAGYKGQPAQVAKAGRKPRRRRLKGKRGRGTLTGDKPPILGLIQRDGEIVIRMLPNVKQGTIKPVITSIVTPGSLIYTDEYNIFNRLPAWGYEYKTVNHFAGEYARDEDGDGFHEVHHHRRFLVFTALLVAPKSWHITGEITLVSRLLRICP